MCLVKSDCTMCEQALKLRHTFVHTANLRNGFKKSPTSTSVAARAHIALSDKAASLPSHHRTPAEPKRLEIAVQICTSSTALLGNWAQPHC